MAEPARPIARALTIVAVLSIVSSVVQLALEWLGARAMASYQDGIDVAAIAQRVAVISWLGIAMHVGVATTTIALAGRWARASGGLAPLVHAGRVLMALSLVAMLGVQAWLVTADDLATMERVHETQRWLPIVGWLGIAALLCGTRGAWVLRIGYAIAAGAWLAFVTWASGEEEPVALSEWVQLAIRLGLGAWWAFAMWRASAAYVDHEPVAATPSDDPVRVGAGRGLATLRSAFIARIVLGILGATVLLMLRTAPSAAGTVAWVLALAQCGLTAILLRALQRYGALPDDALGRGHVALVSMCLVIGALLELYGAATVGAMFDALAQVQRDAFSVGMGDLQRLQARAAWSGRIGSVAGLVAAISLALSLQRTALWLGDRRLAGRATTICALTVAVGGGGVAMLALVQSGALRSIGAVMASVLLALTFAIGLLLAWLSLLGGLATRLGSADPPG